MRDVPIFEYCGNNLIVRSLSSDEQCNFLIEMGLPVLTEERGEVTQRVFVSFPHRPHWWMADAL